MNEERKVPYTQVQQNKSPMVHEVVVAFCYNCGQALSAGHKFCFNCGVSTKVFVEMKHSVPTEVQCTAPAVTECSTPTYVQTPTPVEVKRPTPKPKKPKNPFVFNVIKSSLVLAMAVLLVIAAFLPILKTEVKYNDGEKIHVNFSAVDGISMLVDLCYSMEESEQLKLVNELKEKYAEYYEDWQDGEELTQFSRFIKEIITLYLRSEKLQVTPGAVLVAILSLLQIVLPILLLIFAIITFVGVFVKGVPQFPLVSLLLSGLSAGSLFVNAVALDFSYGISTMITDSITTKLTFIPILACICFVALSALFVAFELVLNKRKIHANEIVKRSLCVAFSLLLLFAVFAPIVTTDVKTRFKNVDAEKSASSTLDASVYASLTLSEAQRDQLAKWDGDEGFENLAKSYFDSLSLYTKREFEIGEAEAVNQAAFSYLLLGYGLYESAAVFGVATVLTILVVLCAIFILCQNLVELATGKSMGNAGLLSCKIAAVFMVLVLLILTIVMISVVNENAMNISLSYEAGMAYGTFLMLVGAVGALSVPGANETE